MSAKEGLQPTRAEGAASPLLLIRSLLLALWVWGLGAGMGLICLPLLAGSRARALLAVRLWSRLVIFGLRHIVGARVEVRGLERLPAGGCLIAAKHQGMFDIVPPFDYLPDPCLVMRKELLGIPIFGWFAKKLGMIVVDREGAAKALRAMVAAAEAAVLEGRQVIIFPEGTRKRPGDPPDYKPGIAGLYRELGLPCVPMATNSGLVWPAKGFVRRPGVVVFEFLPPIPPGAKRARFMVELETAVEEASNRLLEESARG